MDESLILTASYSRALAMHKSHRTDGVLESLTRRGRWLIFIRFRKPRAQNTLKLFKLLLKTDRVPLGVDPARAFVCPQHCEQADYHDHQHPDKREIFHVALLRAIADAV